MGMADIIAAHGYIVESPQIGDCGRIEIPQYFYCQHDPLLTFDSLDEYATHVAEELAKAGYGNVREAKAEVLMEESRVFEAGEWCEPYARADVRDDRDAAAATAWWLRERAETLGAA